ncbi:MAG: hypothetical protein JWM34_785 [Ilumatobacteraceae bacterium]|nr:hypothetical protein [Ilumatobacteraceae bacterium]
MASSSSASKVAKLAQKGKGKKVRFQGGTLFPVVIVIIVALLGALVVYARQSRPGPGEGEPTSLEHWHAALGFYVCDENGLKFEPNLTGTLEETDANGQLISQEFVATGIHSHGDGVMHWHPNSSGKATGTNAKLGVFLNNYHVTLSNTKLAFPASQGGDVFEEGKSKCKINGVEKTASLKVWVWNHYTQIPGGKDPQDPAVYTTNMGDVRIKNDGMVFVVAYVPDDTPVKAPETAFNLPELGAADGSGNTVTNDSTVTSDSTVGTGSTAATTVSTGTGDTSGSTPTSTAGTAAGEPSATTVASSTATTVKAASTTTTGG